MVDIESDDKKAQEKTVALAPMVRRAISQTNSGGAHEPLPRSRQAESADCHHCYSIGVLPNSDEVGWRVCPWCKTSDLKIHISTNGDRWYVARDIPGVWGRGLCLVDALLDAELRTTERCSVWAHRYHEKISEDDRVPVDINRKTWDLIVDQTRRLGVTIDDLFAAAATGMSAGLAVLKAAYEEDENQNETRSSRFPRDNETISEADSSEAMVAGDVLARVGQVHG